MAFQTLVNDHTFSRADLATKFTQEYLDNFTPINEMDPRSGMLFNCNIHGRQGSRKINPIIRHAIRKDIDDIIFTYHDVYGGSYPYKEMEDRDAINTMIGRKDVEWFVLVHPETEEFLGSFTFTLDFKQKRGYARGLVVKKGSPVNSTS